jgi:hypothetical protein
MGCIWSVWVICSGSTFVGFEGIEDISIMSSYMGGNVQDATLHVLGNGCEEPPLARGFSLELVHQTRGSF